MFFIVALQSHIAHWHAGNIKKELMIAGKSDIDQVDDAIAKRLIFRHPELLQGKVSPILIYYHILKNDICPRQ